MMQEPYDIVFIVLVYRNVLDLKEFFGSNRIPNSKTIVVNSFYDEDSDNRFRKIAELNDADYLSVPNRGYGAGNNRGCEYAMAHYQFKCLIISNADITIEKFSINILEKYPNCIIAPKLLTLKGKNQNPSSPFKPSKFGSYLQYQIYKYNFMHIVVLFYALSRIMKLVFYVIKPFKKYIFSAHGAFMIIPYNVLCMMGTLFNEEMFLFFEENHVGYLAEKKGTKTIYSNDIVVRHKEDGSVSLEYKNVFVPMRNSYMKLYEYWNK